MFKWKLPLIEQYLVYNIAGSALPVLNTVQLQNNVLLPGHSYPILIRIFNYKIFLCAFFNI